MWQLKTFVRMYLCLLALMVTAVLPDERLELRNQAINAGITSKWSGKNKIIVYIKNKEYEIYTIQPEASTDRSFDENILVKLFTCINCQLADWIKNEVFELIEPLPLFYNAIHEFAYNDTFYSKFVEIAKDKYEKILYYNERFINMLMKYVSMYLKAYDTSIDTSLLRTLLSLQYRMKYITTHFEENKKIYDKDVIRLLLEILNSVQKFTLINCKLSFDYIHKQLFGFSMSSSAEKNIDTFLDDIHFLNLESHKSCKASQMLMYDTIIVPHFDNITWRVGDRKDGELISVQCAMQRIKYACDFEVMYWYQKYLLNTIMKVLFTTFLDYILSEKTLPDTVSDITHIINEVIKYVSCVPSDMKKLFHKFLSSTTGYTSTTDYTNSENNSLVTTITEYLNVHSEIDNLPSEYTIDLFIYQLKLQSKDFKCFLRLFEFLHGEQNSFNRSFLDIQSTIQSFEKTLLLDIKTPNDGLKNIAPTEEDKLKYDREIIGCEFFNGLYQYCFETTLYLNMSVSYDFILNIEKELYVFALQVLREVNSFLKEITKYSLHYPHLKMVYSISPLIELLEKNPIYFEYFDIKRLVHVVMIEINSYNIKFCSTSPYNYLTFNNLNFDTIGLIFTSVRSEIVDSRSKIIQFMSDKRLNYSTRIYNSIFDISGVFDSLNFSMYDNVIKVNWNGEKNSAGEINKSIMHGISSPYKINSLYHVYYKFSLAVVYYEVCKFYEKKPTSNLEFDRLVERLESGFPIVFEGIIFSIKKLISLHTAEDSVQKTNIADINSEIDMQFVELGISVEITRATSDTTEQNEELSERYTSDDDSVEVFHESNDNFVSTTYHDEPRTVENVSDDTSHNIFLETTTEHDKPLMWENVPYGDPDTFFLETDRRINHLVVFVENIEKNYVDNALFGSVILQADSDLI